MKQTTLIVITRKSRIARFFGEIIAWFDRPTATTRLSEIVAARCAFPPEEIHEFQAVRGWDATFAAIGYAQRFGFAKIEPAWIEMKTLNHGMTNTQLYTAFGIVL